MAKKIERSTLIMAAGNKPKKIDEFIGRVNSGTDEVSIARMKSPAGWSEPGQAPAFNEYSLVLKGMLRVTTKKRTYDIHAGEAFIASAGEWVRYSTPDQGGAEYIAVCCPGFSPELVNRDDDMA